jgi:hypothetical protein
MLLGFLNFVGWLKTGSSLLESRMTFRVPKALSCLKATTSAFIFYFSAATMPIVLSILVGLNKSTGWFAV